MACDGPPGGAWVFVWLTLEALGGWPGAVGVGRPLRCSLSQLHTYGACRQDELFPNSIEGKY